MAREWTLEETRALVEVHIELKQLEKLTPQGSDSRAAIEHWDKVAKRLQDRGYHRSLKSCNKRWHRLEQYEVQIFSFNIEGAGNHPNYWDLTKAERIEHRAEKWPQLPLGEGIDKEIFDLIKRFSQGTVEKKVMQVVVPNLGVSNNRHVPPETIPEHQVLEAKEPELLERISSWSSFMSEQTGLSQAPLDGFRLQARDLRKQRAAELMRGSRTIPYNANHTNSVKTCQAPDMGNSLQQTQKPSVPRREFAILDSKTKISVQGGTSADQFRTKEAHPPFDSGSFSYKLDIDPVSQPTCSHLNPQLAVLGLPQNDLEVILDVDSTGPVLTNESSEVPRQQRHCWQVPDSQQWQDQYGSGHGSSHELLRVAIGNLEVQLHALVNLLQARNTAEQDYQDKMLLSLQSMAISLHTIAQGKV
ncbi:hypothetical protein CY35_07G022000 [Sphagnum magellanicum]|uniref:Uncharacterized protein n=2 Tax=Sphagnum magellanicum TaxID=128215 RepID=A0ACB8HJF9_9BRYO|nr:hypothetical protein CY35_07G022000 [Sphagnum magellanicum]KAH9556353.1 hypothetical protein CY35_07G022000 [Sphagnum magellanicum]